MKKMMQFSDPQPRFLLIVLTQTSLILTKWNAAPLLNEQWLSTTKVAWLLTTKPLTWLKFEWICCSKQNALFAMPKNTIVAWNCESLLLLFDTTYTLYTWILSLHMSQILQVQTNQCDSNATKWMCERRINAQNSGHWLH